MWWDLVSESPGLGHSSVVGDLIQHVYVLGSVSCTGGQQWLQERNKGLQMKANTVLALKRAVCSQGQTGTHDFLPGPQGRKALRSPGSWGFQELIS